MSEGTLVCNRCGYENIILTCGFCIQCGGSMTTEAADASGPGHTAAKTTAEAARAPSATPLADLARQITQALDTKGIHVSAMENGWLATVDLTKGRQQKVYLLPSEDQLGNSMLAFTSLCGTASASNALKLLEWNSRLFDCAFAARTVNGNKLFVLTANRPLIALDEDSILQTVRQIAVRADHVESRMEGEDRY